jgi:tetratricopeptide (TPR) repeat protein
MMMAAARAQDEGRLPDAAALLEKVLREDPDHHEALCRYAMLAMAARRPEVALRVAERGATVYPGSAIAQNILGVAFRMNGRLADAIGRLRSAVALDPDLFDAQVNLGNALLDAGDPQAALPCYQKALALNPRAASVHNNLGNLYRELRRPTDALAAYRRAIALEPMHAGAHGNLGNALKDLGDTEAAIAAFRHSLASLGTRRSLEQSATDDELPGPDRARGHCRRASGVWRAFCASSAAHATRRGGGARDGSASATWLRISASTLSPRFSNLCSMRTTPR